MTSRTLDRGENSAKSGSVIPISEIRTWGEILRLEIWDQVYTSKPVRTIR